MGGKFRKCCWLRGTSSSPTLPCALRRWPWPLQTLVIPSSHPHHDPRAVAGAQSNTVLQYHPVSCRVAIEKTLKSNCFNLKVFVGKISCISSTVLVSITHDVSSTDACQMNESSCTGRPLLSKISRLRAGQFHTWQSYRNSSMASKCFKQLATAGFQCIQWVEWLSCFLHV